MKLPTIGVAEIALQYPDIIIRAAMTVDNSVGDIEENMHCERQKIQFILLMRYMGKGTEGLQEILDEFEAQNDGTAIPTQVRLLSYPCTIRERRQN
jgi:small ligand-binding sensory domain FIST